MTNFVRAANPIWWIPDLVGQPLNDEYYAFFRENTTPFALQNVFRDPDGTIPWSNPLQFEPAGTLPNNLYFDERLVYRIEIRHSSNPLDPLIYEINNFVPGITITPGNTAILNADNMITNPQFADVYFYPQSGSLNPSFTFAPSSPGNYTIDIGPGWRLDLEGSGTVTVEQFALSGDADSFNGTPGNPTYFIDIANSGGWTSVKLVQRFSNNGAIFANGAIAIAFLANATTSAQNISVQYAPSVASSPITIFSGLITLGTLQPYSNILNIPPSTNTDIDGDAFVDIAFVLPIGSHLSFTNVQITGQSIPLPIPSPDPPTYQEITYERSVDQEFNVYKPALFSKRIPSILVGWDFPLNPAQFNPVIAAYRTVPVQAVGANKSYYAWDQTILFQSANSAITVSSPASNDLTLTAAVNTQMAMIQYLPTNVTRKILAEKLAVNIAATSSPVNGVACTVSLWYTTDATLPDLKSPNFNSFIATLDTNGKPATFQGGTNWFEVPRPQQREDARFVILRSTNAEYHDYNFHGWDLAGIAAVNNATFFAIVIGTAPMTAADSLHFNSVGLMNGELATRPGAQSTDEILRECQVYYEKSYQTIDGIGKNTGFNAYYGLQQTARTGGNLFVVAASFSVNYKVPKRVNPAFTPYSTVSSVPNNVLSVLVNGGAVVSTDTVPFVHWDASGLGIFGIDRLTVKGDANFIGTGIGAGSVNPDGFLLFHYTADARLGIV